MKPLERNNAVDGLKGIAILIVIFHHFALAFYPAIIGGYPSIANTKTGVELFIFRTPLSFLFAGYFAVSLFFLITGYILAKKTFLHRADTSYVSRAIYMRIFRLMPLIAIILLIGFVVMSFGLTFNVPVAILTKSPWLATFFPLGKVTLQTIITEVFTKIPFVMAAKYYNVLWIIPSILIGSWIAYAAAHIFHDSKYKFLMFFVFLIGFYNSHFMSFILGVMIAEYEDKIKLNSVLLYLALFFALMFGSSTVKAFNIAVLAPYANFVKTLAAAFFFIACTQVGWISRLAQAKVFTYFGRNSYYYYLTHMLALITLSSFVFLQFIPGGRFYEGALAAFIIYCVGTVVYSEILKKIERVVILRK